MIIYFIQCIENTLLFLDKENLVKRTKLRETLLFMFSCSILMFLLRTKKFKGNFINFWFYHPLVRKKFKNKDQKCLHQENCLAYITKGTFKYFTIGYSIGVLKLCYSQINNINYNKLFTLLFDRKTASFGLLLGWFVFSYRTISCLLSNTFGRDKKYFALIAGFFAGTSYYFKPNLTILATCIATCVQIVLKKYENEIGKLSTKLRISLKELTFSVLSGFLIHNYIMHMTSSPKYVQNMIKTATNGKLDKGVRNFVNILTS